MSRQPKQTRQARPRATKPLETRDPSIREKAYVYIQQLVASGRLPAGSGISELQLSKDLGSSRTPIREAMNQLAAEGMLEQAPSGGMLVRHVKREDIIELYELREALEVYAVGRVATTALRDEDRKHLQHLIDGIAVLQKELVKTKKTALNEAQMERFLTCDLEFHALLMSMTHNTRLQKVINDTRLLISVFAIRRRGHDLATLKSIQTYHQTILDSVVEHNREAAMSSLSEHIRASQQERLMEYDDWRRASALQQGVPAFFNIHRGPAGV
jgi:DNA-binding GntR family transcriptional regulator